MAIRGLEVLFNIPVIAIFCRIYVLLVGEYNYIRSHRNELLGDIIIQSKVVTFAVNVNILAFRITESILRGDARQICVFGCVNVNRTPLCSRRKHWVIVARHIRHIVELALTYSEIVIISEKHIRPLS